MRLANKLTVTLGLGAALVLTGKALFDVQREQALFDNEALREERLLGSLLGAAIGEVWRAEGEARALELVHSAHHAEDDVAVRWVWVDEQATDEFAPRLPLHELTAVKEGRSMSRKAPQLGPAGTMLSYTPVDHGGGPRPGAIEVSKSLYEENRYIQRSLIGTLFATVLLVLIFVAMSYGFGSFFITTRVQVMIEQLRRVGAGDLTNLLSVKRRDELSTLAGEMNRMTHQLRHADRLTTVGTVAAGVAHELGTPLHVVSSSAKAIVDEKLLGTELEENVGVIVEQSKRMASIIRNLLDFARRRELKRESYDVRHIVDQAVSLLKPAIAQRRNTIYVQAPAQPVSANVDLMQVQQAITNLVINAMHASPEGANVDIVIDRATTEPPADLGITGRDFVRIAVVDKGSGMTDEVVRQVWQPFFTTKPVGEGTGLGLPIAYAIVREHDGYIDIQTEVGKGSRFTIYLPAAPDA